MEGRNEKDVKAKQMEIGRNEYPTEWLKKWLFYDKKEKDEYVS